jgi:hypothetical protein
MRSILRLITILLCASPALASAQDRASARGPQVEAPAGDVIQLDELVVEGEIEKPNAFYILNRTRFGYEVLDLRTSFLPDVVDSVQGDPF